MPNLPTKLNTISALNTELEKYKTKLSAIMPSNLSFRKLKEIISFSIRTNPKLLECTNVSLLRSIFQSVALGLEPGGPLQHAHLVPYWNAQRGNYECQLIIDYKGYIDLARRSGKVGNIYAKIVYENEKFEIIEGTKHEIIHNPLPPSQRGEKKIGVYAVAKDTDGGVVGWDWIWAEEVEAIKERVLSQKKNRDMNPWITHEEAMWLKTAVRKLAKWLPLSPEFQKAAIMEEYNEAGIKLPITSQDEVVDIEEEEKAPVDVEEKTLAKKDELVEKLSKQKDEVKQEEKKEKEQVINESNVGLEYAQEEKKEEMEVKTKEEKKEEKLIEPKTKKSKGKDTETLTFGPPNGPKIEIGLKPEDYKMDDDHFICPPGGERAGMIVNKGQCANCQYLKMCFLHN